jgi:cell division protein FtsW
VRKAAIALLLATLVLVTIGVVVLSSTSSSMARDRYGDAAYLLKRQAVWLAVGVMGMVAAAGLPYPKLRGWCVPVLVVVGFLLVLVLVPGVGRKIGGARRWLGFGGINVQPSEFAKLALVVWLAHYLAREKRRLHQFGRGFVVPMGVTGAVLALTLAEPDFGSTALLGAVAFALMFVAGVRLRYLAPTLVVGVAGLGVLAWHSPNRLARLLAFTDLEKYKATVGYQVWQAILAIGSGGWSGVGLGDSRQKLFYLPEAHTDFIFPIIGEEFGLIGTLGVLLLFAVLVAAGAVIALKTPDLFGQYLGLGITLLVALQALINIGVVTAWLPTKGLALPFISYGGSNLMMNLMAVGILLSLLRHGAAEAEGPEQEFFAQREALSS